MVNGLGYTDNLWLMIKHKPTESQQQKYPDAQPHVHLMIHTFECDNFTRVNLFKSAKENQDWFSCS
jgi:hypothetical protein